MKRMLLVLSLITIICSFVSAQSVDSRLQSAFSAEFLQELSVNQPHEIRYLNWYLDNSYRIIHLGVEKCALMQPLVSFDPLTKTLGSEVNSIDEESFNVFLFSIELQYDKKTYYRIGNTGYAVEFESLKKITENYNIYNNE